MLQFLCLSRRLFGVSMFRRDFVVLTLCHDLCSGPLIRKGSCVIFSTFTKRTCLRDVVHDLLVLTLLTWSRVLRRCSTKKGLRSKKKGTLWSIAIEWFLSLNQDMKQHFVQKKTYISMIRTSRNVNQSSLEMGVVTTQENGINLYLCQRSHLYLPSTFPVWNLLGVQQYKKRVIQTLMIL